MTVERYPDGTPKRGEAHFYCGICRRYLERLPDLEAHHETQSHKQRKANWHMDERPAHHQGALCSRPFLPMF